MKRFATKERPCNNDPEYDYYRCTETYFYKRRGCQYPWNIYHNLNLPICTNFSQLEQMIEYRDRNKGYRREQFTNFERMMRTNRECPPPCHTASYNVDLEQSDIGGSGKSLQIAFADFRIVNSEEYSACDQTCVI